MIYGVLKVTAAILSPFTIEKGDELETEDKMITHSVVVEYTTTQRSTDPTESPVSLSVLPSFACWSSEAALAQ